jgi:hypothetical protein
MSNSSGVENWEYGCRDPSCWPCDTLCLRKLALTSLTSSSRSWSLLFSYVCPIVQYLICLFCSTALYYWYICSLRVCDIRHEVENKSSIHKNILTQRVVGRTVCVSLEPSVLAYPISEVRPTLLSSAVYSLLNAQKHISQFLFLCGLTLSCCNVTLEGFWELQHL